MKKKIILIFLFLLIAIPYTYAKQGHIPLLAVKETQEGYEGSIADLYLEIKPGNGRVFLDTFPLTKLDTQMSTRFGKEIACNYLNINCGNYDFIYTIRADSAIVGGPSAGAAITALTISLLDNLNLKKNITITGTINSGGLIGPVGGLKAKIDAGAKKGLKKILIPQGERFVKQENSSLGNSSLENNSTKNTLIDLAEYARNYSIGIIEVSDLNEVIYELTGKKFKEVKGNLIIDRQYKNTMRYLASLLCNRSKGLFKKTLGFNIKGQNKTNLLKEALNLTEKGENAFKNKSYYSSASYCFGANVKYSTLLKDISNLSQKEILHMIYTTKSKVKNFSEKISKKEIKTITDLEAYMIVEERLTESEDYLDKSWLDLKKEKKSIPDLAYSIERLYSAYSWYVFFDNRGKEFNLNKEFIKKSCINKLSEAEERYQYLTLFFPHSIENTKKEIKNAYSDLKDKNYELCLFKASKAKASVDMLISVMGVEQSHIDELLSQKLSAVKKILIKETKKGTFPVLGYSYYEYANTLKKDDKYSALLYSEYALELANLDMYFKEKKTIYFYEIDKRLVFVFIIGVFVGFITAVLIKNKKTKKELKTSIKTQRRFSKRTFSGKKR